MADWFIFDVDDGVSLPFGGPSSVKKRIIRKQTADKLLQKFAVPIDLGPDPEEMQIKGRISPAAEAVKLYDVCKRAEQDAMFIKVNNDPEFKDFEGQFLVSKVDIGMNKPEFDAATGKTVRTYDITFIKFTDDIGNGDSGEGILDEEGIGFGDFGFNFEDFDFLEFILGADIFT